MNNKRTYFAEQQTPSSRNEDAKRKKEWRLYVKQSRTYDVPSLFIGLLSNSYVFVAQNTEDFLDTDHR